MEELSAGSGTASSPGTASRSHPQAAVRLEDIERTAGVLFRAMGGDPPARHGRSRGRARRAAALAGTPGAHRRPRGTGLAR